MFQTINETIKVTSSFFRDRIMPEKFEWRGKNYNIQESKIVHIARKGEGKIFFFEIRDSADFFTLSFDTKSLEWELNQIFVEK